MRVNFYATLRDVIGGKSVDIHVPSGGTIRQFLDKLVHCYPALRRELFNERGELYQHVHVIVNGRDVPYLEDTMDTVLSPEDTISIFPAVGGGCD